jgi:disulfide bond formation protein DsbB
MNKNNSMLENGLYLAWVIALIATLGSLYFSEILMFYPCELCWYQRIFMYPFVLIIGIAAVKKDFKQVIYILPLSIIGTAIAFYHYLIQKLPALAENGAACGIIPCNFQYINWLGFMTIPFLAFIAFLMITVICLLILKGLKERNN